MEATQFDQWLGLYSFNNKINTKVWGYGQVGQPGTFPDRMFEAKRHRPVVVKWINDLKPSVVCHSDAVLFSRARAR